MTKRPALALTFAPWWQRLALGVALAFAAAFVRAALDRSGMSEAPYAPFITAVLLASVWCGRIGGATAATLGAMLALPLLQGHAPTLLSRLRGIFVYGALSGLIIAVVDAMQRSLAREAAVTEQLGVVSRELHHRVKNVITLAISVVQQSGRSASSTAELQEKVVGRLLALGNAQDLLIAGDGAPTPLRGLVDQILTPFDVAGHLGEPFGGPDVFIPHDTVVVLSLILNELATNATKYGALSVSEGRLGLHWSSSADGISLTWIERGGPPTAPPAHRGFGSRLFASALSRGVGRVQVDFEPEGLKCLVQLVNRPDGSPS